jgi:hypothetical protein
MTLDGGRILVTGWAGRGCGTHLSCAVLARYTSEGALDRSFGRHGVVKTGIGKESFGEVIGVRSDGRIVVGGNANQGRETILIRYEGG